MLYYFDNFINFICNILKYYYILILLVNYLYFLLYMHTINCKNICIDYFYLFLYIINFA